jgi:hypothetical protein
VSGATSGTFVYDGDNQRVKGTVGGVTTFYAGKHYEVAGGVVKKYYYAGDRRIAMRDGGALYPLLGDHPSAPLRASLGSTAYIISPSAGVRLRLGSLADRHAEVSGQTVTEFGEVARRFSPFDKRRRLRL